MWGGGRGGAGHPFKLYFVDDHLAEHLRWPGEERVGLSQGDGGALPSSPPEDDHHFDDDFDYDGGNADVVVGDDVDAVGEACGDDVNDGDGVELSPGGQAILACLFDVGDIIIMIIMRMMLMVLSSH